MFTSIKYDDRPAVECPVCAAEWKKTHGHNFDFGPSMTHFERVDVAGRPIEDGEVRPISIGSNGIRIPVAPSAFTAVPGRRDAVSLVFSCEEGHEFAINFQQHKGVTFVTHRVAGWVDPE